MPHFHKFHICTIANDLAQYARMKQSFLEAGFDEDQCVYTLLDNSHANIHEPYSAYNDVLAHPAAPYILFCHQDILLDRGHGIAQLQAVLAGLDAADPLWAVAGNAGFDEAYRRAFHIYDPHGYFHEGTLPCPVYALDENFLVVRSTAGVRFSAALSGFHLYGTDLCLNALRRGCSCYAVDFLLTHLSAGNSETPAFEQGIKDFQRVWNPLFRLYYVRTPCICFLLSRYRLLHPVFGRKRFTKSIENFGRLHVFLLWLQKKVGGCDVLRGGTGHSPEARRRPSFDKPEYADDETDSGVVHS